MSTQPDVPMVPNLEQAKIYIQSTDFSGIVDRLTYVENWPRKKALQAVQVYRNYLYLLKKYPDDFLPPSYEIDEAWHAHIVCTRSYTKFCQELFGYYQHHDPHVSSQKCGFDQSQKPFDLTQELYKKEFGDYLYRFGPRRRFTRIRNTLRKIYRD